jgi:hypothetical protein
MLKRQGNYTKANKLVAEAQGIVPTDKKPDGKTGEALPQDLPF